MIPTLKQHRCGRILPRSVGFLLILLVAAGLFCGTAGAQPDPANPDDWLQSPPDETLKGNRIRVQQIFVGGFASDADRALFENYYKRYDLKRWTMVENRADVEAYRRQLQVDLRNAAKQAEVHATLSALVLNFMSKLAADYSPKDFHPAPRVNAMLMIGQLNDKEEPAGPAPKEDALPVLAKAVSDPEQLDAVRAVAMVGIIRHGKLDGIATDAARSAVGKTVVALLTAPKPAARSADAHAWMQGQAAEILGLVGTVDSKGTEAKLLALLVRDSKLPFSTRCLAAEAMGKLNYSAFVPPNPSKVAAPFGKLALDACNSELSGRREFSRNHLKVCLIAAAAGLKQVDPLAIAASDRKFVDDLKGAIGGLLKIVTDRRSDDREVEEELEDENDELKKLTELLEPAS